MDTIGERIKLRRELLGLTQKQIYSVTKISSGNLSEYENGIKLPSSKALIELSKVLQCSIDWILLGENIKDDSCKTEEPKITIESQDDKELIQSYHLLSASRKEALLTYINYLVYEEKKVLGLSSTSKSGKKSTEDKTSIA